LILEAPPGDASRVIDAPDASSISITSGISGISDARTTSAADATPTADTDIDTDDSHAHTTDTGADTAVTASTASTASTAVTAGPRPVPAVPLLLSARTPAALNAQATRLHTHLTAHPDLDLRDVGYSLVTARAVLPHRAAVVAADPREALDGLAALAAGRSTPTVRRGQPTLPGRTAFLFTGQGSQRPGMGRELHDHHPVFAAAWDEAAAHLDPHLDRPLHDLVFAPAPAEGEGGLASALDATGYAQPALFAFQVALFRLLESFGLRPDAVAGHSIGEIAAAHVAGVLTLPDAAALVAVRGRLMQQLPAGGVMVAVAADEDEVLPLLAELAGRTEQTGQAGQVGIAAVNAPKATVLSGAGPAVDAIVAVLAERGVKTRRLRVSHAFHSPLMEPILTEFGQHAATLSYHEPRLTVVSTLTGAPASGEELRDAGYWVRHARDAVRFADAVRALHGSGVVRYLEIGPDAVLTPMADAVLADADGLAPALIPLLRRGRPEPETLAAALGAAFVAGVGVDWRAVFAGDARRPVPLPTYPFQRERYWITAPTHAGSPAPGLAAGHPLADAALPVAGDDSLLLTGRLTTATTPWLADHAVAGSTVLPGAAAVATGWTPRHPPPARTGPGSAPATIPCWPPRSSCRTTAA
ncbi:acyltransferase domain-containing protein, partial [Protofrankia coriariae]|uniref:acyltransferase domain-containing protein n=1 Tax=Protofrankia coriariae TaxID=1562887 RepID=UPI000AE2A2F6